MELTSCTNPNGARRSFIGGSDARIMMGADEGAPFPLWREKRGEVEPEDLSGNLIVQLGLLTEPLNRHWYERNAGRPALRPDHFTRTSAYLWVLILSGLRRRTPGPPPFSSINSTPAVSKAKRILVPVSSRPPKGPS